MRSAVRVVTGGLCGVTAAVAWAVSLAVYQQVMEPTGFFTDPDTGQAYLNLAANNTYWPREVRHMAILLALAGVAVICRAGARGLAAGAVGAVVWLGADLWLDRVDVDGRTAASWLAAAGIAGFVVTAGVAARLSRGRPGGSQGRFIAAATLPMLAALSISITTPFDEPVTDPHQVGIENALTVFQIGLVAMFLVALAALLADGLITRANAWWVAAFLILAVVLAGLTLGSNGSAGSLTTMALFIAGLLAVVAARDVPRWNLLIVGITGVVMLALAFVVLFLGGMIAGPVLTSLAGNPAVNGADTDLSLALPGVIVGVLVAKVIYVVTTVTMDSERRSVPAVAEP